MDNRKRVGDRNTTVDSFRRRTVTVHYESNRPVGKEPGDEGTERRIQSVGG